MIYLKNNTDTQMVSIPRNAILTNSSVTEYATEAYVDEAIQEAISGLTGITYEAGTNIDITNDVISVTGITVPTSNTAFTNDAHYTTSGEVQTQIEESISGITGSTEYSAGTNIDITNDVISVTGITSYTGVTSQEIITALGYTPAKVTAVTEEQYTQLQTKDANTIYGIIE